MSDEFKVKRGMVFFLNKPADHQPVKCLASNVPEKKRPYIVVSNDKCNEFANLVHVAPVYTRSPSSARIYEVPFKSVSDRDCVVDVASIMLVPKELLNTVSYSSDITHYTIANSVLLDGISRAVMRQFDVKEEIPQIVKPEIKKEEVEEMTNFTLNINLNGVPFPAKVSTNENEVTIDFSSTNILTPDLEIKEDKGSKFKKLHLERRIPMTEKEKKYIEDIIKDHAKKFGGDLSYQTIANNLNVSLATVSRVAAALKKRSTSEEVTNKPKYSKPARKFNMSTEQEKEFITAFEKHNAKYVLSAFKSFGFENIYQVYGKVRTIRDKMRKNKNNK